MMSSQQLLIYFDLLLVGNIYNQITGRILIPSSSPLIKNLFDSLSKTFLPFWIDESNIKTLYCVIIPSTKYSIKEENRNTTILYSRIPGFLSIDARIYYYDFLVNRKCIIRRLRDEIIYNVTIYVGRWESHAPNDRSSFICLAFSQFDFFLSSSFPRTRFDVESLIALDGNRIETSPLLFFCLSRQRLQKRCHIRRNWEAIM
jgi:hypothetical protein